MYYYCKVLPNWHTMVSLLTRHYYLLLKRQRQTLQ